VKRTAFQAPKMLMVAPAFTSSRGFGGHAAGHGHADAASHHDDHHHDDHHDGDDDEDNYESEDNDVSAFRSVYDIGEDNMCL
jgi:hypothetical protein